MKRSRPIVPSQAATLLVLGLSLLLVLLRPEVALYWSNQNSYYPHGLRLADPNVLAQDWFVSTAQPHLVFSYLVATMQRLGDLASFNNGLELALRLIFYASLLGIVYYALGAVIADIPPRRLLAALSLALYILIEETTPLHRLLLDSGLEHLFNMDGLAGHTALRGYLQPSTFGIFMLAAIALLLYRRELLALLCLTVASYFHVSYLIHCAVLVLLMAYLRYQENARRLALLYCLGFALAVLPVALYSASFLNDPARTEAIRILAYERQPHHALTAVWWHGLDNINTLKLLMMGAATVLVLRLKIQRLQTLMAVVLGYTAVTTLLAALTQDPALGLFYPWRASVYLIVMAQILLLAFALARLMRRPQGLSHVLQAGLGAVVALLLVVSIAEGFSLAQADPAPQTADAIAQVALHARQTTDPDAQILLPPEEAWQDFRLLAQRAVYVDWKSHPYRPTEVLEWWGRMQFVRQFYSQSASERLRLCRSEGLDYYVNGSETSGYTLVACL